jgi:hypothetical protein
MPTHISTQSPLQPPVDETPEWAGGLNIRTTKGPHWQELLVRSGTDPQRLRQIQPARGYRPAWLNYFLYGRDPVSGFPARPGRGTPPCP